VSEELIEALLARARDPERRTDIKGARSGSLRAPANLDALDLAEATIGRPLPLLLRAIYLRVADGGFGPGHGLLSLLSADSRDDSDTLAGRYQLASIRDPDDSGWIWPPHLVPFCDWGGWVSSCADCSTEQGAVLTFDPDSYEKGRSIEFAFARTHASVEAWFSDWLAGVDLGALMFEPDPQNEKVGINPFTKQPMTFKARRLRRST